MLQHKRHGFKIVLFAVFMTALFITGCAKKKGAEKVVAIINDYEMTIEDFNYESKEILRMGKMLGGIPVTKEDMLEALITREILVQEAHKEGLDTDKDFMKTIELYWEQTLLRNLLVKKAKDIAKRATVYDDEIGDYYNKMKTKLKAKVFVFANEKSARKALSYKGDILEYTQKKLEKISFVYAIPSKWYILGEGYSPLVYSIFNIDKKNDRGLIKVNDKWGLVVIEERVPNEVKLFSALREKIANNVRKRKEKEMMDNWIDMLRSKANVRINQKVLNTLH